MVSKASEDLPEPLKPVMTTSLSRGILSVRFLRLCSRAPPILIDSLLTDPNFSNKPIGKLTKRTERTQRARRNFLRRNYPPAAANIARRRALTGLHSKSMIEATTRMMASQEQKRHLPSALAVLLLGINAFAIPLTAAEPSSSQLEQWWSLRPLREPAVPKPPAGKFANWPRNELDRFILAKLLEKGLSPSPQADKPTLLRRVCFDLSGLPPTAEEMRDFLRDRSPRAFARVVERLLASPRYGERWARHWLDVVHYADTHGNDQDRPRPNAWPYRDYLIRSFNTDKTYPRCVQEQLAGDVLFPDAPQGVVATGFIAAGPWDESSQKFIVEDTVDKKIARNLDRDDMVMTTMSTLVSTTAHCARCHNHKFDPISQAEYYGLQAVFAGVDRAERPYDLDAKTHVLRQSLLRKKRALEAEQKTAPRTPSAKELAEGRDSQAELQKVVEADAANWTVLDPATFASAEGATLTKQADSSVLSSGKLPDKDTDRK